ncbi:Uncharacterised protein [Brucella anthropi]|nr:Uncharacterised protein [Brucella anthropi]
MLMAWGPFRFTVPNYSVETVRRSLSPRMEKRGHEAPFIFGCCSLHGLRLRQLVRNLRQVLDQLHADGVDNVFNAAALADELGL